MNVRLVDSAEIFLSFERPVGLSSLGGASVRLLFYYYFSSVVREQVLTDVLVPGELCTTRPLHNM